METGEEAAIRSALEKSGKEREAFCKAVLAAVLVVKSPSELETFIETHQALLVLLMDRVYQLQEGNTQESLIDKLYTKMATDLESCLKVLKEVAPYAFNQQTFAPRVYQESLWKWVDHHYDKLFNEWLGADSGLSALFSSFNKLKDERLTFQQIAWLESLIVRLTEKQPYGTPVLGSELNGILLSWNFNAPVWLDYVYKQCAVKIIPLETGEEKQQALRWEYKQVCQLSALSGAGLYPEYPSAKDQVLDWLRHELEYWVMASEKKNTSLQQPNVKIYTSVSVPVLALFTRLFKDAGVITNTNLQELIRFMTSHYTTSRKESIAHSHFHSKYYAIDEPTKRKVNDLLLQLVQLNRKIG